MEIVAWRGHICWEYCLSAGSKENKTEQVASSAWVVLSHYSFHDFFPKRADLISNVNIDQISKSLKNSCLGCLSLDDFFCYIHSHRCKGFCWKANVMDSSSRKKICVKIANPFVNSSSFYINDLIVNIKWKLICIIRSIQLSKKDFKVYS